VKPHEKAEELLHLLAGGVPVEHALTRVDWTPSAAYRWAVRTGHTRVREAVRHAEMAYQQRCKAARRARARQAAA
jgi:hypothetical protein